ncbi:FhaA domain-containing protein [Lapillicoccus sp.]|uniref:FhaA domain-containing protein n=1 Tax=Lapillicoccus sp. TaxID=1909287 RepID=UPI0027C143EC|nr:DUF3662 domain-containing protein [Actinomycetota bacterium]
MGLFDKVERGLERAVNSAFAKAFKSEVQPVELASAIRRAMDDRAAVMGHGRTMVPNIYTVELSTTDFDRLSGYEDALSDELVAAAQEHADSQRYQPGGPVQVTFHKDDELETGVFRVRPATSRRSIAPSTQLPQRAQSAQPAPQWAPEPQPAGAPAPHPHANPHVNPAASAPSRPAPSPVQRPWLVIDGERYPLIGAHTVIGRDELADIVLDDPGISRRHCEVRVTNDGPHLVTSIRDLGSTNGTYVNGERITSTRLGEGDQITVGRTQAVFRPGKR